MATQTQNQFLTAASLLSNVATAMSTTYGSNDNGPFPSLIANRIMRSSFGAFIAQRPSNYNFRNRENILPIQIDDVSSLGPSSLDGVPYESVDYNNSPGINSTWKPKRMDSAFSSFDLESQPLSGIYNLAVHGEPTCIGCDYRTIALYICRNCDEYLCRECKEAHRRVRATKTHLIELIENQADWTPTHSSHSTSSDVSSINFSDTPESNSADRCKMHKEKLRFLCFKCNESICHQCLLDSHGNCFRYGYLKEEHLGSVLINLQSELIKLGVTIAQKLGDMKNMPTRIRNEEHKTLEEIHQYFGRLIAEIENRREQMKKICSKVAHMKTGRIMYQYEHICRILDDADKELRPIVQNNHNMNHMILSIAKGYSKRRIRKMCMEIVRSEVDSIDLRSRFTSDERIPIESICDLGRITNDSTRFTKMFSSYTGTCRPIYALRSRERLEVQPKTLDGPTIFENQGAGAGQFARPWGVCCNRMGDQIFTDRHNHNVKVFDSNFIFLYQFGSKGSQPGQMFRPTGICINPFEQLVVADKDNHRIQIFTMRGIFILEFGQVGTNIGEFLYPWDVATNSKGEIAVSDSRNHRVQLFTPTGVFITKLDSKPVNGKHWIPLDLPRGICFTPEGRLLITCFNSHSVIILEHDWVTHSEFLRQPNRNVKIFSRPEGIACDDMGNIVVCDSKNNRILVCKPDGEITRVIGENCTTSADFNRPAGICVDPSGRLVVVDFGNIRIQRF